MGVWIETTVLVITVFPLLVTPCMGVWIETASSRVHLVNAVVTPCMGVWIETIPAFRPFAC